MSKPNLSASNQKHLRYGENPHQNGWVWQTTTQDPLAFFKYKQLQGKELSYNNYLDIDAAVEYLSFTGSKQPTCIVVKHTNACGAAANPDIEKAFVNAWNGDSLAAFGSIIAVNRRIDASLAALMLKNKRFFEVVTCPSITTKALKIFSDKQNLRVLVNPNLRNSKLDTNHKFHQIRGGLLVQDADLHRLKPEDLKTATKKEPTSKQLDDLIFAWNISRVSKANCIALVKNQQLISSGVGQQDRMRCCQLAINKAEKRAQNTVAASDAFFPFKDGPDILIKSGVKAIIQPGGSIRDQDTIDLCDQHQIAMVFTGIRCFRH